MKVMEEHLKIKDLSEDGDIFQYLIARRSVYSAREITDSLNDRGKDLGRAEVFKNGDRYSIVILPPGRELDLERLKKVVGSSELELATDEERRELLSGSQREGLSPLDYLYNTEVFLDDCLAQDEEILQFAAIVWPKVDEFCLRERPPGRY